MESLTSAKLKPLKLEVTSLRLQALLSIRRPRLPALSVKMGSNYMILHLVHRVAVVPPNAPPSPWIQVS